MTSTLAQQLDELGARPHDLLVSRDSQGRRVEWLLREDYLVKAGMTDPVFLKKHLWDLISLPSLEVESTESRVQNLLGRLETLFASEEDLNRAYELEDIKTELSAIHRLGE